MLAFDKLSERYGKTAAALAAILKAVTTARDVPSTNMQSSSAWPLLPDHAQSVIHNVQNRCFCRWPAAEPVKVKLSFPGIFSRLLYSGATDSLLLAQLLTTTSSSRSRLCSPDVITSDRIDKQLLHQPVRQTE